MKDDFLSHNSPKGNCFNINSVIIWEYSKVLIDPFESSNSNLRPWKLNWADDGVEGNDLFCC